MKEVSRAWRQQPLTVEQWKANCEASSHIRHGDELRFVTNDNWPVIECWIAGTSVHLGAYFIDGDSRDGIAPGTGWCHA